MLGKFQARIDEQSTHDLAISIQTRLVLEQRRQDEGIPIRRYNWDLYAAIWMHQLTDPATLERDPLNQLIGELSIKEEVTTQLPFARWLSLEPDPTYTAHHPWLEVPGGRGADVDSDAAH
eukprot:2534472-Pyramimonas_sp.AAC.1